jgi:hypothetical protein
MTYGTVQGVASLSYMWTNSGVFLDEDLPYVDATKPSFTEVESWLLEVSSSLDLILADEGFYVPVVAADVLPAIENKVQAIVKDMVDYSHGAGRFFVTQELQAGASPMMVVEKELREWVKERAIGFANMGVPKRATGRNTAQFTVM